jgi:hypothetical protein
MGRRDLTPSRKAGSAGSLATDRIGTQGSIREKRQHKRKASKAVSSIYLLLKSICDLTTPSVAQNVYYRIIGRFY